MRNFVLLDTCRTGSSALAGLIGLNCSITRGWEWTREVPLWYRTKAFERALAGDFSYLNKRHQEHMAQVLNLNSHVWDSGCCFYHPQNG